MEPKSQQCPICGSIERKWRNLVRWDAGGLVTCADSWHDAPPAASTGTRVGRWSGTDMHYQPSESTDHCPKCGEYLHDEMGHMCPAPAPSEPEGSAEQFKEWAYKFVAESINTTTTLVQDLLAIRVAELVRAQLQERDTRLRKEIMRASNTFFYVMNLSHRAWEDKKNLQAVCERINAYGKMEHDLLEAALKEDSK